MMTVRREVGMNVMMCLKPRATSTITPETVEPSRIINEDDTTASSITITPTPCRCLFGPVDRAANAADAATLRASLDRLSAARWGFDFLAGRPLPDGRFDWAEVHRGRRRSAHAGNDVIRDRAALQQVNDGGETTAASSSSSSEFMTSSKRRRHAVTSSKRRRRRCEISREFDDAVRHVICAPASQQHRNAKCRLIITGINLFPIVICLGCCYDWG